MVGDLFHVGHLNIIKRAKELGDVLVVGVHSDADAVSYKRAPIINEGDRYEMIRSCKFVDEVIEDAPLRITEEYIKKHRIDLIIHGDDVTDKITKQHEIPIKMGIIRYIPYTRGISTTKIIARVRLLGI
jgi:ethanolamine-phosphate cytidylyltransferase